MPFFSNLSESWRKENPSSRYTMLSNLQETCMRWTVNCPRQKRKRELSWECPRNNKNYTTLLHHQHKKRLKIIFGCPIAENRKSTAERLLVTGRLKTTSSTPKCCVKLRNRRVPNGTHGGVRGRMPGIMGILLLDSWICQSAGEWKRTPRKAMQT